LNKPFRLKVFRKDGPWTTVLTHGPDLTAAAARAVQITPLRWPETADKVVSVVSVQRVGILRLLGRELRRILPMSRVEVVVELASGATEIVVMKQV
jgi:hypothetical protein